MTDASATTGLSATGSSLHWSISRPALALLIATACTAAALLVNAPAAAGSAALPNDAELIMLLRFMAAIKALLGLGALAAAMWRLGYSASPLLSTAYMAAPALMCAAPVMIWQIDHVAAGAATFHCGLAILLLTLYADRGRTSELAGIARRSHGGASIHFDRH